eukprot:538368-Pelagomonas_calceolata.AAC.1
MGMSAFKKNVDHPAHHLGHHIDHRQGKQCHHMWPARLSRYGHEYKIKPQCGQCVWVNPSRNIWAEYKENM